MLRGPDADSTAEFAQFGGLQPEEDRSAAAEAGLTTVSQKQKTAGEPAV
jgi:hypothetical protein